MTLSSGAPLARPSVAGQVIEGLAGHIASQFAGALPAASPSEMLRDLQLGPLPMSMIRDPLQAMGYKLETVRVVKPLFRLECTCSMLTGQGVTYYLIQAPKAILDNAIPDNWGAFNGLAYAFEKRTRLFILCDGLDAPARAYREIIEHIWREGDRGITASYIPWRDITDLIPFKPEDRADLLRQLFGLEERTSEGPLKLGGAQRQQLQVALLSAFPDRGGLEQMVSFRMGENLAVIAGDANLGKAVFELIEWADSQGRLEELIRKAREANPGNPELADFAKQILES